MRRPPQRSPLQSFRFWFVLLSFFAMAVAWKLDLFGNRKGTDRARAITHEELPDAEPVEPVKMLSDVSKGVGQTAPEPVRSRPPVVAELPTQEEIPAPEVPPVRRQVSSVAPAATSRSPFGPANPEFIPLPEAEESAGQTFDRNQPATGRQTAMLDQEESMPPDLTRPRNLPAMARATQTRSERHSLQVTQTSSDVVGINPFAVQQASTSAMPVAVKPEPEVAPFQLPAGSQVDLARIDQLIENGDEVEAHRLMSEWYWKEPASRPAFMSRIESLANKIYQRNQPHFMDPHVVKDGEMLSRIAREYGVTWQYLARLNRTDARRIKPGQKLKVIKGPFSAVVDLSDYELTIHAHGYFVKRYQVGTGRDGGSPTGTFKILEKLEDPTYYGPNGVIAHDDPENPLGEYWLSIGDSFGIHGTIHPDTIGKAESDGCIRLRNEDIAEVYDFLTVGSEVVIRP